jgi:hypothetical protein
VLNRTGGAGSFEALAARVSRDVHPASLLQELERLGVARRAKANANDIGDQVSLCVDAFVPKKGSAEMLQLFADNAGDHVAVAVHNLKSGSAPMLEQSVFADSLRPESIAALNKLCREIWLNAFHDIVRDATAFSDQDQGLPGANQRMRVGMYFYHGPNLETQGDVPSLC